MPSIPTCIIGGSDEKDMPFIIIEIENMLTKDIIKKIIHKEFYFIVYFHSIDDFIDCRISRFIYNIQKPNKYFMIHYKNEDVKSYTYVKKAPYKLLE
jgi:hypothetical protein